VNCRVKFLDLSFNKIITDKIGDKNSEVKYNDCRNLDLSHNQIDDIHVLSFFSNLRHVNLKNNHLELINFDGLCQDLPTLISLNLKFNNISDSLISEHAAWFNKIQIVSIDNYWNETASLAFIQKRNSKIFSNKNSEESGDNDVIICVLVINFVIVLLACYFASVAFFKVYKKSKNNTSQCPLECIEMYGSLPSRDSPPRS
jgi:hypothetical protein